jgi:DNA replication and repair protein RecF
MQINSLDLMQFRNYETAAVHFSPGVNVIYGDNAQGKTNLLESISYLSTAKSFRSGKDAELIRFGDQNSLISARIFSRDREVNVEARLVSGARKSLFINGVRLKTAAELSGVFHTVVFCPEDLNLIREGGAARRAFLNNSIGQLRPKYAAALTEYNRLYAHKTRILRDYAEKPSLLEALDEFSLRMAQVGAVLIRFRAAFSKKIAAAAAAVYRDCSGGKEALTVRYETVKTVLDTEAPAQDICRALQEHQASHKKAELETRSCLSGPHKDDLVVEIDGHIAKTFASQGQVRTAALALKLAEWELHFQEVGERPVVLLTTCSVNWTPPGRNTCCTGLRAGRSSSPAARKNSADASPAEECFT